MFMLQNFKKYINDAIVNRACSPDSFNLSDILNILARIYICQSVHYEDCATNCHNVSNSYHKQYPMIVAEKYYSLIDEICQLYESSMKRERADNIYQEITDLDSNNQPELAVLSIESTNVSDINL